MLLEKLALPHSCCLSGCCWKTACFGMSPLLKTNCKNLFLMLQDFSKYTHFLKVSVFNISFSFYYFVYRV